MPHADIAHGYVDLYMLSRIYHGSLCARQILDGTVGSPQRRNVDSQFLVLQKSLDALNRCRVASQVWQRRIGCDKSMRAHESIPRRHVPLQCLFRWHVAVLADTLESGQVKCARCIQGHAAVVPVVELILTAQPAIAIDPCIQADLVTGGAELRCLKEGLEHLPLVDCGTRLHGQVVHQLADTSL